MRTNARHHGRLDQFHPRTSTLLLSLALVGAGLTLPALAKAGCNPPVIGAADLGVNPVSYRGWNTITINYHDQCGAEQQTRVYAADAIAGGGWQLIRQDGPDSIGWRYASFSNLDPGGRYCFEVEVVGNDGVTRRSQRFCTHTNSITQSLVGGAYDGFYDYVLTWRGIDIISSSQVSSSARYEVLDRLELMIGDRLDLQERLRQQGAYMIVVGVSEAILSLPECMEPDTNCTDRRGLGGTVGRPLTAVGEENLLDLPQDDYDEDIFAHEFGHSVENLTAPAELREDITGCYAWAIPQGLWQNTYAATNVDEYWATATQAWFDLGAPASPGITNGIDTRAELLTYDPCVHTRASYTYDSEHLRTFLDPADPSKDLHLWRYGWGRLAITGGRNNVYYGAYVWEWIGSSWVSTWIGWHYGAQDLADALDDYNFGSDFYVKAYRYSNGPEALLPAPGEAAPSNPDRVRFYPLD